MIDVRDNLKTIISERGYIQAVIAKKANMTPAQLSGILNKNRRLDVNEFIVLCEVLRLTPEELLNYRRVS